MGGEEHAHPRRPGDRVSLLDRAIAKAEYNSFSNTWSAYLTPAEVLAMYDAGAIYSLRHYIDRAKADKEKGESRPSWVTFAARKELAAKLPKTNKKVGTKEKL